MKKIYFLLFSILLHFFNAQNMALDPAFGTGGYSNYDTFYSTSDAVMLSDGQFITATSTGSISIRKVKQNGMPDPAFGTKNHNMGANASDKSELIKRIVLHNNKILIYGRVNATPTHSLYDLFVTRINLDGTLDTSFGTNGFTTQSVGQNGSVYDMVVDSDGNSYLYASNNGYYLTKVNSSGMIDTGFGTNGKLALPSFTSNKFYIQNDGKLVMAGSRLNTLTNLTESYIERRLPDGTYDSTFGNNGMVFIPNTQGTVIKSFEYNYSDNSILCLHQSASSSDVFFLSKTQISNGAVISSFANNGRTSNYFFVAAPRLRLSQITVLPNSKIVAIGSVTNFFSGGPNINEQLFVTRFNANGSIDYTASSSGFQIFMTTLPPPVEGIRADYINKLFNANNGSLILAYSGGSVTTGDKSYLCKFIDSTYLGTDSVPDKDQTNLFTLYPNPAGNTVTIQNRKYGNDAFNFKIYDLSGKIAQTGSSKFNDRIDVQHLEKGNYIIQIETKKGDKHSVKLRKD
ncbi:T9SS type A sorting domain-containing protein [Chryseobacterium sp. OSA05B]|uniref:T9SS type A sorting domain-containing protein n=1 Tax=Chryseobacterium sp. OSA05B TaxID=2862650 RepID=UPI001CBB55F2|nr:T9SS type A sorting domain-containing protein [Chryseobacterium sp. OSA05B]